MDLDRFGFKVLTKDKRWMIYSLETQRKFRMFWHDIKNNVRSQDSRYDIDTATICQCTGIRDSEGKLIYENDVIQRIDGDIENGQYVVEYNPFGLHFQIHTFGVMSPSYSDFSFIPLWMSHGVKCVVIGNRFTWLKDVKEKETV